MDQNLKAGEEKLYLQEQQGQDGSLHLSGNHIWGHSQALW